MNWLWPYSSLPSFIPFTDPQNLSNEVKVLRRLLFLIIKSSKLVNMGGQSVPKTFESSNTKLDFNCIFSKSYLFIDEYF